MNTPAPWVQIHLPDWKGTFISQALLTQLLKDYELRGHPLHPPTLQKSVNEGALDRPGMCFADRKWVDVPVEDGFRLSFPNSDAEYFYDELRNLEARTFPNGEVYYKLHGWIHCVVLNLEQRMAVLRYLEANMEAIRKVAAEENARFDEAMGQISKASQGKVIHVKAVKDEPIPEGVFVAPVNHEKN
jgi:hypothetical protein